MPLWLSVPLVAVLASAPAPQAVEIDRTLQHVYNTAIMASDVRQAKQLKLVADVSSDERILTALENRLLLLREVSRVASPSPATTAAATTAVIATRRQEWTASWPPGTDVPRRIAHRSAP